MKPSIIESLLDAERRAPQPSAEVKERVQRRVEATLGLATAAAIGAASTQAGAAKAATTGAHAALAGKAVAVKLLAAAVGAALLGGGAYIALQQKTSSHALAPEPEAAEPRLPPTRTSTVVVPHRPAPLPMKPTRPHQIPRTVGLADEQAFLEEARAALRNGSPERALQLLSQHEHVFPNALLGDARESLAIQALVAQGRVDAARARAIEFRRRYPRSLFQAAVDASLPR
jgi:hypothetical protein